MMKFSFKIFVLAFLLILVSCKKDEEQEDINVNPYSEQGPIDDAKLVEFLTTHYYNEEEFANANNITNFDHNISFSTEQTVTGYDSNGDGMIGAGDIDVSTVFTRTALIDLVETQVITLKDANNGNQEVDHNLYILKVNQGGGPVKPRFCDASIMEYRGFTLELESFDSRVTPFRMDLSSLVRGFYEGASSFNVAGNLDTITQNPDGTYTYEDFGNGAVFMPSALAYYASPVGTAISSYSPIIFTMKVFTEEQLDHDDDGVPTYLEDRDNDRDVRDDNTDGDSFANYGDLDDDGDTVPTREEVEIEDIEPYLSESDPEPTLAANEFIIERRIDPTAPSNANVVYTIVRLIDTDGDGKPNYVDGDDDGDGRVTSEEDADGDGQVTDDDTDGDGIPDYLDTDN